MSFYHSIPFLTLAQQMKVEIVVPRFFSFSVMLRFLFSPYVHVFPFCFMIHSLLFLSSFMYTWMYTYGTPLVPFCLSLVVGTGERANFSLPILCCFA